MRGRSARQANGLVGDGDKVFAHVSFIKTSNRGFILSCFVPQSLTSFYLLSSPHSADLLGCVGIANRLPMIKALLIFALPSSLSRKLEVVMKMYFESTIFVSVRRSISGEFPWAVPTDRRLSLTPAFVPDNFHKMIISWALLGGLAVKCREF